MTKTGNPLTRTIANAAGINLNTDRDRQGNLRGSEHPLQISAA